MRWMAPLLLMLLWAPGSGALAASSSASSASSASSEGDGQVVVRLDAVRLEAFLDGLWHGQKAEHALAGAVVTVVQDGAVLLSKGYG